MIFEAGRTPLQNDRIVAGGLADQGEYPSQVKINGQ
jgi:secreted trypsin-like serine protease